MFNPLTINPLQIKLALIGAGLVVIALLSLTTWALLERSGRLECKVELVEAKDQVAVLSSKLEDQTKSINNLSALTAKLIARTGLTLDKIDKLHENDRVTVAGLEALIKKGANGKSCADYLKEWRAEP